jgi:protein TonB
MSALTYQQNRRPRYVAIGAIIAIHALIFYALTNSLNLRVRERLEEAARMTVVNIQSAVEPSKPKPIKVKEAVPQPETPPPEAAPADPTPPAVTADAAISDATALSFDALRSPDAYYPPMSAQLGETGAAIVQVCVSPQGRLESAPQVAQTSGFPRLDAAAVKWASEALRFRPATSGGVPVRSCAGYRVKFRLK